MIVTACKPMKSIGIVTIADDLHAYAIRKILQDQFEIPCFIFETDRLADTGQLTWSPSMEYPPHLPCLGGAEVNPRDLGLIWWRRPGGVAWRQTKQLVPDVSDEAAIDIIKNDCLASFQGILFSEFEGKWVSDPDSSRRAENKLLQLQAAKQVGLRIPRTLISQNPAVIRDFCAQQSTIVKTVAGTTKTALMAQPVTEELLIADRMLMLSPAIYQEQILGENHLRIQVFGEDIHAVLLTCPEIDWRVHLDQVSVEYYPLPNDIQDQLIRFTKLMNLEMGIFDMKFDLQGNLYWLEVNPQGQFLFLEGMSDIPLGEIFSRYLANTLRT